MKKSLSTKRKPLNGALSVVIPCEPGGDPGAALRALAALPKPEKALIKEVFVAWGRHPSRQRNLAVQAAKAPWVLFLDADSLAQPGLIPALLQAARGFDAVAAGGPNLALADEPGLGRAFDRVLASWAGSGASRARYTPVGEARLCGEKELILCNLMMAREAFLESGGFREDLYPNEENELFNRLRAMGHRLAYVPAALVRRPRRRTVAEFTFQAFRYGRGRTQQMRRNFFVSDLVNLAPLGILAIWCFALWALAQALGPMEVGDPMALETLGADQLQRAQFVGALFSGFGAIAVYASACFVSSGLKADQAFYLALRHHAYAIGLLVGAFQNAPSRPMDVRVQRVKLAAR